MVSGYSATKRLLGEKPKWFPIVLETLGAAKKYEEFAGSWVLREVREKREFYPLGPGLRALAAFGILKRTETSRSGQRAYYVMPDPKGVERALKEVRGDDVLKVSKIVKEEKLSGDETIKLVKEVKKSRFGNITDFDLTEFNKRKNLTNKVIDNGNLFLDDLEKIKNLKVSELLKEERDQLARTLTGIVLKIKNIIEGLNL
ncbi:MAG: hypothetical protein HQ569_05720 [Actinobacteria bacterium]|nr:hypothetical protein [Actinomycetota bacterium]